MMNASTLSGAIYAQIMSELDEAVALGDEMVQKGLRQIRLIWRLSVRYLTNPTVSG